MPQFLQTTLANGLTLIGEMRESALSVGLGFFVKSGARDETAELSGVSHFLEHMMFKGTKKRSALEISYAFGAIGAQSNAYTSEECTVYYTAVLPEYFADAFEILADMLHPTLDENEFNTEKGVILEEIALYKDRPTHLLFESALRHYFAEHPAGNPVLGSNESVQALSAEMMREYFKRRYSPKNIIVAASGAFNWENFISLAEKYCSTWQGEAASRVLKPHTAQAGECILRKEKLLCAHLCLIGPGPSAKEELLYPAHVLSCILGDSTGSRAYWELIDKGLADTASIDVDDMDDVGLVYAYLSTEPERIDEVEKIMRGILATPNNFSDEELERAKTKIGTRLVLGAESSMRRLMSIGGEWLSRSRYLSLEEDLQAILRVSRTDIEALLSCYSFSPVSTVKLLPA